MPTRTTPGITLVTGSAQGIGAAIAEGLVNEGGHVILLDILPTVDQTARRIGAIGSVQCDVTDVEALQHAVHAVAREHRRLDTLVNCAGTCARESFEETTLKTWHRDLDTNLTATAFACQAAVFPHMKSQGSGRIVNVASVSGKIGGIGPVYADGSGGRSGAAYTSAKAGAINLTRWIAKQVGPWGITCNAVCPGPIETHMTDGATYGVEQNPIPRMGTPEEIAAAVCYFVDPRSGFTTGAALHVDGGMVLA